MQIKSLGTTFRMGRLMIGEVVFFLVLMLMASLYAIQKVVCRYPSSVLRPFSLFFATLVVKRVNVPSSPVLGIQLIPVRLPNRWQLLFILLGPLEITSSK